MPGPTPQQYTGMILPPIQQGMAGAQGRPAPQLDPTQQAQFRAQQLAQLGQLGQIATGAQAGAGELAVQRQVDNALAAQQAASRMSRGSGAGLAARAATRQAGALGVSGAGMSQQAALGDQMAAQGLMSQISNAGRGQDIGLAGQNANLSLQQQQLNDQYQLGLLDPLVRLQLQERQGQYGIGTAQANQPGIGGALLGAAGQVGAGIAMSDERVKTDIADGRSEIDEMLDGLRAKRYRYKNEERHGKGARVGIMAQDLERTRAGSRLVVEVPDGKGVDINKAVSAALAASARLNERLRKVERKAA